ncbi:MAG: hypothetical protein RL220_720 [Bacteroidota bacterium]
MCSPGIRLLVCYPYINGKRRKFGIQGYQRRDIAILPILNLKTMKSTSCLYCGEAISGRSDKKFCDDQCRSNFHYQQKRELNSRMNQIHAILRRNRRALDSLCTEDYLEADARKLIELGFVTGYSTHLIADANQEMWFVCYDVGVQFLTSKSKVVIRRFRSAEQ